MNRVKFAALEQRVSALEARLDASSVPDLPYGGATFDVEEVSESGPVPTAEDPFRTKKAGKKRRSARE